jgi:CheY-like chemotaxis protein
MPAHGQAKDRPKRHVPARPWVVLLVDDEPDILEAVGDLVEAELPGVRVLRAASGREGLRLLQDERVDGIIADFNMEGMDGLQFLVVARQCHPTIPRVMFTADLDPDLPRMARDGAAVEAFLSKGAEPDELLDQVCSAFLTYTPAIRPAP